jgi:hypothetical protein
MLPPDFVAYSKQQIDSMPAAPMSAVILTESAPIGEPAISLKDCFEKESLFPGNPVVCQQDNTLLAFAIEGRFFAQKNLTNQLAETPGAYVQQPLGYANTLPSRNIAVKMGGQINFASSVAECLKLHEETAERIVCQDSRGGETLAFATNGKYYFKP